MLTTVLLVAFLQETFKVSPDMDTNEIQTVIDGAGDGDTVQFAKGYYDLIDTFDVDNEGVTLKGSKAVIDSRYDDTIIAVTADNVTVTGFIIVNPGGSGVGIFDFGEGGHPSGVTVHKNTIISAEGPAIESFGDNVTITQNKIIGCDDVPLVHLGQNSSDDSYIAKNVVMNADVRGIDVQTPGRVTFEGNKVLNTHGLGIRFQTELASEGPPPATPTLFIKNTVTGNTGNGIEITDTLGLGVTLEKNTISGNGENGVDAEAVGMKLIGNKVERNGNRGLRLALADGELTKNKVQANGHFGIEIFDPGFEGPPAGDNTLDGNTVKANARDGINLDSSDNTLDGNKVQGNLGDGLDIKGGDGNVVNGNTFSKNGHEGIDNSGTNTDITGNKCSKNARGEGPDIAGAGGGAGTVGEFADNTGSGGELTQQEMDLDS